MLDREILAPAKRPADCGVADDYLLERQLKDLRDLAAIFVQPLAGGLDHQAILLIDKSDAGLGLEEGMILPGGVEFVLDHHVGLSEALRNVALADGNVDQDVAAMRFVN